MDIWTYAVVLGVFLASVTFLSHDVTYSLICGPRWIDCGIWLYWRAIETASQKHSGCEIYVFRIWLKTFWFCSCQTFTQNFHYSKCSLFRLCGKTETRLEGCCLVYWWWIRMFNSASTKVQHRTRLSQFSPLTSFLVVEMFVSGTCS